MQTNRHFLSLLDFSPEELQVLIRRAAELKNMSTDAEYMPLRGKSLVMIFEKSSTRTRISFEIAMRQLGGYAIFLSMRDTQLGRGELIEDSARVLSRLADVIMLRTFEHQRLIDFAEHSGKPVINGLTDYLHPCQLLADMLTYYERKGDIKGRIVAWVGDGNNMCHSYINAAKQFGFRLRVACPSGFSPDDKILSDNHAVEISASPQAAVAGADLVVTDVWVSMGQEAERTERLQKLADYQVNSKLMASADKDAIFLHCLPAHRGEEVSAEILESAQSGVWDAAENRMHSQKALLEFLLIGRNQT